jgi:hypothetical protein
VTEITRPPGPSAPGSECLLPATPGTIFRRAAELTGRTLAGRSFPAVLFLRPTTRPHQAARETLSATLTPNTAAGGAEGER